jgi:hypothetical protein
MRLLGKKQTDWVILCSQIHYTKGKKRSKGVQKRDSVNDGVSRD